MKPSCRRLCGRSHCDAMDAVIFDLDGTLWDSRENVTNSWNVILRRRHPELAPFTAEAIGGQMGKLLIDIGRALLPDIPETQLRELMDECCSYECEYVAEHGGVLYDGLEDTLRTLSKKYRLYIVSNCQSGYIEAFFAAHGLERYYEDYRDNGTSGLLKAANIKLIIEQNKLSSAVYVGDTALDGASARENGIPFVLAGYGFGDSDDFDARIDDIRDLPEVLAEMDKAQA